MDVKTIINSWKKKTYEPVYWIEGDEPYFINQVTSYAEHHILTPDEAAFNLSVLYGKETTWTEVLNNCSQYPAFAEKRVVLVKEAQQLKDIDKLENYIKKPAATTVLIVIYSDKKIDKRTAFAKTIKDNAVMVSLEKVKEGQVDGWLQKMIEEKGLTISPKAKFLMVDHIGNDLARMENEIDKIIVNLGNRKQITEEEVDTFVGISKDFNVFELQKAVAEKNLSKCIRIIQYFEQNPKAAESVVIATNLYNYFSKMWALLSNNSNAAAELKINPYFIKEYQEAAARYGFQNIQKTLLLLQQYNLGIIGINTAEKNKMLLLKETITKIILLG